MKQMIYRGFGPRTVTQLHKGNYKGFDYYILAMGNSHPCAYVDVVNTSLKYIPYRDIDVRCHGGLTYSEEHLSTVENEGWFIGWDYAHYGDFIGCDMDYNDGILSEGKKWSTEEICLECRDVINQIIWLENKSEHKFIDASILCNRIFEDGKGFDRKNGDKNFILGVESALEIIHNMPDADIKPIVHAHWTFTYYNSFVCSNCSHSSDNEFCYCPNCGAKMDIDNNLN